MIEGSCLCGAVHYVHDGSPDLATACDCSACRRYGVLWIYGYEGEDVRVAGPTTSFIRGDSIVFHFCATCGCLAYWRAQQTDDGRRRIAVNLRLAALDVVADIPVEHLQGATTMEPLPLDGTRVKDLWN